MAQDVQKVVPQAVSPIPRLGRQAADPYADARSGDRRPATAPLCCGHGTMVGQPSLAGFVPPSSPSVAKGIGAMSAFRPPLKLPRGATIPVMPKHFANGSPQVPGFGPTDSVPSMLTPGEAVLTPGAAQHVGRSQIAALNAMHPPVKALSTFMPPVGGQATTAMRAGARGIKGALSNTKLRPKMMGGLSG